MIRDTSRHNVQQLEIPFIILEADRFINVSKEYCENLY